MGLAFLRVAGLGDGDVEKEPDLRATNTDVDPEPGSKPGDVPKSPPGAAAAEGAVLGGVAGVGAEGGGAAAGAGRPRARVGGRAGRRPAKHTFGEGLSRPTQTKPETIGLPDLEELDRDTEEPDGLCRRRPRGGDPTPGRLLGDLDRRHGSFHSSGRLMTRTASFFKLGSTGLLRGAKGARERIPPPFMGWWQRRGAGAEDRLWGISGVTTILSFIHTPPPRQSGDSRL